LATLVAILVNWLTLVILGFITETIGVVRIFILPGTIRTVARKFSIGGLDIRGGARHFHLGGPVLQQRELSMVCVGLSERDLKKFWGARQNCGGAPPLLDIIKLTKTPLIYSVSRFNLGAWSFV